MKKRGFMSHELVNTGYASVHEELVGHIKDGKRGVDMFATDARMKGCKSHYYTGGYCAYCGAKA